MLQLQTCFNSPFWLVEVLQTFTIVENEYAYHADDCFDSTRIKKNIFLHALIIVLFLLSKYAFPQQWTSIQIITMSLPFYWCIDM